MNNKQFYILIRAIVCGFASVVYAICHSSNRMPISGERLMQANDCSLRDWDSDYEKEVKEAEND